METKHKNALIGGLLAVVVVMAVGYAAFSQALIINGNATIDSNWQIRIIDIAASTTGSGVNAGAEVGSDYLSASFNASLTSPGDTVTYTITVENQGTIDAKLSSYNWNSDAAVFLSSSKPFFRRGGYKDNGSSAGIFAYSYSDGAAGEYRALRLCLVVDEV